MACLKFKRSPLDNTRGPLVTFNSRVNERTSKQAGVP